MCVEAYENGKQSWGHKDKGSKTAGKLAPLDSRPEFRQCQGGPEFASLLPPPTGGY